MKFSRYSIGVDLGGTNVVVGATRGNGRVVRLLKAPTGLSKSPTDVVGGIAALISRLITDLGLERGLLTGVGVGVPGLVDAENGIVRRSPNFVGWEDVPLSAMLEERICAPVVIDHDVRMITRGEWAWGAGRGARNFICVTLGTGIGMGIVADGRIYAGAHGNAGELGHVTADLSGPRCGCGNLGCVEKLCAGPAIAEIARKRIEEGAESAVSQLQDGRANHIDAETVFRAAKLGDAIATSIIDTVCELLGSVIAGAVLMLDPERVIVGGGIADAGDVLFDRLRAVVARRAYSYRLNNVTIVPWALGDKAGVLGAAHTVEMRRSM
ncbi:MAG: ROK family protein [Bacillota bacterium]